MTPAELKTLRESLGLTTAWVAEQSDVTERTVKYWEAGRSNIPDSVSSMLTEIDLKLDQTAVEVAGHASRDATVVLSRYRNNEDLWSEYPDMEPLTVTTHAVLLQRTLKLLTAAGIDASIEYWD